MFCCTNNNKILEKKPFATARSSCSSYSDLDDIEAEVKNIKMYCSGKIDSLILLRFIALFIIIVECLGLYFSKHQYTFYVFAGLSLLSFIFFCTIFTAIQEENRQLIQIIIILFFCKIFLMTTYIIVITLIVYTDYFIPYVPHYFSKDSAIIIEISIFIIILTIIQIILAKRAYKYFKLRDELYTIPSVKVHQIRPELAHVLTRNKY
uniref:Transmembrane protein n=1 Tax=Parastrongyloides trichosuri TaxID=131310 RepID=A0A0N4ZST6_PARTI